MFPTRLTTITILFFLGGAVCCEADEFVGFMEKRVMDPNELHFTGELDGSAPLPFQVLRIRGTLKNVSSRRLGPLPSLTYPRTYFVKRADQSYFVPIADGYWAREEIQRDSGLGEYHRYRPFYLEPGEAVSVTRTYGATWARPTAGSSVGEPATYELKIHYAGGDQLYSTDPRIDAEFKVDVPALNANDERIYAILDTNAILARCLMSPELVVPESDAAQLTNLVDSFPMSSYADYARFALARWDAKQGRLDVAVKRLEQINLERFPFGPNCLLYWNRLLRPRDEAAANVVGERLLELFPDSVVRRWYDLSQLTPVDWSEMKDWVRTPEIPDGTASLEPMWRFAGDGRPAVALSPDGTKLVIAGSSRRVKVLTISEGAASIDSDSYFQHRQPIEAVAWSPDGKWIVSGGDEPNVVVYDVKSRVTVALSQEEDDEDGGLSVAFSPDGKFLLTSAYGKDFHGRLLLWDTSDFKLVGKLDEYRGGVVSLSFSVDGNLVCGVYRGSAVVLWDVRNRKRLAEFTGHDGIVMSAAMSPDGRLIASADTNGDVKLWDVEQRTELTTLRGHKAHVWCVAFSPDSTRLVTCGYDCCAKVWDVRTHKQLAVLVGDKDRGIWTAAFSPDGTTLITADDGRSIMAWDLRKLP